MEASAFGDNIDFSALHFWDIRTIQTHSCSRSPIVDLDFGYLIRIKANFPSQIYHSYNNEPGEDVNDSALLTIPPESWLERSCPEIRIITVRSRPAKL